MMKKVNYIYLNLDNLPLISVNIFEIHQLQASNLPQQESSTYLKGHILKCDNCNEKLEDKFIVSLNNLILSVPDFFLIEQ